MSAHRQKPVTASEPELFVHFHAVVLDSPIGKVWIESDGELITRVSFEALRVRQARPPQVLLDAMAQMHGYLGGRIKKFDLPLQLNGTTFQKLVWDAIADIPWGSTRTYQSIANSIGGKAIARTVGGATGSNPLPIIVPCHRVIGSDGMLTGYVGGLWRKRWMLTHEGALDKELFAEA